jgi:MFS family permease
VHDGIVRAASPYTLHNLTVCSGLVTVCQGLVVNKAGLYATRFMLGVAETGMFPGAFYLIGMWYKRTEAQKRFSFFFSSTSLAGAFGGLIAAGINRLDGALGHRAWRWIFIIEGAITMFFAVVLYFGIPDFPENAKFLTEKERRFVTARLVEEQGGSGHGRKTTFKDVVGVFKDYKIVVGGFMYFGLIVPAYGYAYFAPTIIQTFKYSPVQTQLHSVPPWAAAFGWSMILAWFSDRARHRYGFIMFSMCLAIVGFGLMLSTSVSNAVKYAALHLLTSGVYGSMPIIVCWFNLNLGGHLRRSVGSAWQVGFGNIGGIIATYSFLAKDKPRYIPGFSISLAFVGLAFISCTIYFFGILRENKRKDSTTSHMTEHEKQELGDLSPDYRYMY